MWGATCVARMQRKNFQFQSTRPVWGATVSDGGYRKYYAHFNPRAPCGARRDSIMSGIKHYKFQSTRPVWGATWYIMRSKSLIPISIHAPRVGRDLICPKFISADYRFQSTRPVWGATARWQLHTAESVDFNPRAPCGARLRTVPLMMYSRTFQSTRPVWGATFEAGERAGVVRFQSTRPVWGATRLALHHAPPDRFQSTRPVWGATIYKFGITYILPFQSTRPVWGATGYCVTIRAIIGFQSTRPVWGATNALSPKNSLISISIHAPRVGRDDTSFSHVCAILNFNPRAPCGARPRHHHRHRRCRNFNPRAPCGARPQPKQIGGIYLQFQSTRPVWGATAELADALRGIAFQSTRPVWGATFMTVYDFAYTEISIHAPRVGRDGRGPSTCTSGRISLHAPRVGRDRSQPRQKSRPCQFQSTRPVWGATPVVSEQIIPTAISIHAPRVGRDSS